MTVSLHRIWRPSGIAGAALALLLPACGGGGGGSSASNTAPGGSGTTASWVAGVFPPSARYAAQCANPRPGTSDVAGSTLDEKLFLRSWTHELYLWFSEVPDRDPAGYATALDYFDVLKTTATTSTGHDKDRFHFTYPTTVWDQLQQSGIEVGYGVTWDLPQPAPPRQIYAALVWPGGAAAQAGVMRGAEVLQIDGVDAVNAGDRASVDKLNAGLNPATAGETHSFLLQPAGGGATFTVSLTSSQVTENPVPTVTTLPGAAGGKVGYLLFTSHIAPAEQGLIDAINQLKTAAVNDLVLDLRYNGGGLLEVASELAYMIAGPGPTAGQTFELQQFNSQHPSTNPVTGQPITPTPFLSTSQGLSTTTPSGTQLPTLGLTRVYVLTGSGTCSASEAVLNSLTGVGLQVIQVGSTTCGKPYGFYPQDNCGTTYFSIEFRGVNARGFGDYSDGFSPQNSMQPTNAVLPGCSVADDFGHGLGDPQEGRLAVALSLQAGGSCPLPSGTSSPSLHHQQRGALRLPFWRENRVHLRRTG